MNKIGILHIADLHYKSDEAEISIGDVKDATTSAGFRKQITYENCWDLFINRSPQLFVNRKVDIIACTGDLGSSGDKNSIKLGAQYIGKLADRLKVNRNKVIVTPGNHDLNRKYNNGKEFAGFFEACKSEGLIYATCKEPALLLFKNIPVISLNTCLGGTEHAVYGLPSMFWDKIKQSLKVMEELQQDSEIRKSKDLTFKLQALDIPAIGKTQFENAFNKLRDIKGNLLILLTHHNPLPTFNLEVRPYANLVDSGELIFSFICDDRRVILLHGHSHCNSSLTTFYPEDHSGNGFISTIGATGLHGQGESSVAYIEVLADNDNNFLAATINRFTKRGFAFVQDKTTLIPDLPSETINKLNIDSLQPNHSMPFRDAAKILKKKPDEKFAEELIRTSTRQQLSVEGIMDSKDNWIITKRG